MSRPIDPVAFEAFCVACATLAVKFECLEHAPDDTPILCASCGRIRGLVGAVRRLANLAAVRDAPADARNEVDDKLKI